MKSFRELTLEAKDGGIYMSAGFDDESLKTIQSIQKTLGVDDVIVASKLHTTVVYSRKTVDIKPAKDLKEKAQIVGLDLWDTKYGKTLVAKLDSPYLTSRFNEAMALGATYDYDDYRPHVTLSYNSGLKESLEELKNKLQFPYDLVIVSEHTESLDLDKKLDDITN